MTQVVDVYRIIHMATLLGTLVQLLVNVNV